MKTTGLRSHWTALLAATVAISLLACQSPESSTESVQPAASHASLWAIADAPAGGSQTPSDVRSTLMAEFVVKDVKISEDSGVITLLATSDQSWLQSQRSLADASRITLSLESPEPLRVRCYPLFEGMSWFAPDLYGDSPEVPAGKARTLSLSLATVRQMNSAPLKGVRLDFLSAKPPSLKLLQFRVERSPAR